MPGQAHGGRKMKAEEWYELNGYKEGPRNVCRNCVHAEREDVDWFYCGLMEEEGVIRDPQLKPGHEDETGNMVSGYDTCRRFVED
jgi:hypothetical protein